MSFYLRFISESEQIVTLKQLQAALPEIGTRYRLDIDADDNVYGELFYDDDLVAQVELNLPDDEIFEEDLEELVEFIHYSKSEHQEQVLDLLNSARFVLAVRPLWAGDDPEPTLDKLEPLWDWMFKAYRGLLQIDGEGFYNHAGILIEFNLKI